MKRLLTSFSLLMASLILPAHAALISIVPQSSTTSIGEQLVVDLTISGLGDKQASSLATFDIDFIFDSNMLTFQNAMFGNQLDLIGLGSWQSATEVSSGLVNLFELSFDSDEILNSMQAGSFILASLVFDVIGNGTANLLTQVNALGDANNASPLTNVELVGSSVDVAEPSIALLMGLGLAGLLASRRLRGIDN
ncbi:cohesin domain-containing protein [Paraglaciecola hydrolytica]|uniref:PEP-CTERM protein-sorting domain-containing protein n=1 Tax=Paraglaciecola hydrolytica TaxID=1799789 RepID=A0A148KKX3_9ALTE|nr:cohesin domain-containing protein [Paraglaciecola hydrolytica]KXI26930.1 hypothetical protein AX660_02155 [Paraglaciecola hydrolytica]